MTDHYYLEIEEKIVDKDDLLEWLYEQVCYEIDDVHTIEDVLDTDIYCTKGIKPKNLDPYDLFEEIMDGMEDDLYLPEEIIEAANTFNDVLFEHGAFTLVPNGKPLKFADIFEQKMLDEVITQANKDK